MKFEPIIDSDDLAGVIVTHPDEERINFAIRKSNGKRSWRNLPIVFDAVNGLFSTLTMDEQLKMYKVYSNIYDMTLHKVEGSDNFDLMVADLQSYLSEIFELLPLSGICEWATGAYRNFAVPETIGVETTSGNYPPSTSYNRHEYLELCGLSTALKLTMPITYEFMKEFKDSCGVDFKEYSILQMFTPFGIRALPPFVKLIAQATDKLTVRDEITVPMGLLMDGIGSETYPMYAIAPDLIRTLCLSETDVPDIRDNVPNNITAKLTKAIDSRIESIRVRFNIMDTIEPREKNGGGDAGNTSNQEVSMTRQRFSDLYGRVFIKEYSRPDLYKRFDIDEKDYRVFQKHVTKFPPRLTDEKMIIMSLCLNKFANIEAFTLLPSVTITHVTGVCAALMHKLELYNLVNFILAREDTETTTTHLNQYIAVDAKPNKELLAEVRLRYEDTNGGGNGFDEGLKELVANACKSHWILMSPEELHESYKLNIPTVIDRNFKDSIIKLTLNSGV